MTLGGVRAGDIVLVIWGRARGVVDVAVVHPDPAHPGRYLRCVVDVVPVRRQAGPAEVWFQLVRGRDCPYSIGGAVWADGSDCFRTAGGPWNQKQRLRVLSQPI